MRVAPVLVALLLVGLPAPAGARIVIGSSIHGVSLGATESRVRAVLGSPDGPRDFGEEPSDYGLDFLGRRFHALFATKDHRAFSLSTTSSAQQTASGVGPGVSATFARARLHGERCGAVYDADRQIDVTECVIRRHGTETSFGLFGGSVFEVEIAQ